MQQAHLKHCWREFDIEFLAVLHRGSGQLSELIRLSEAGIEDSRQLIKDADALLSRSGLIPSPD